MQTLLTEIASRHSVYIERLKTSQFKKFEKFLRLMDEALKKRLAGKELTDFSTNRIEKLINSVVLDLSLINRKFLKELNKDFADFAAYEAEFEIRALNQVVKNEFILPTSIQLGAAVLTNPLSVSGADKGALLAAYLKQHTDRQVAQVANAIRTGYYEGQTTNKILQAVRGTRKNKFTDGILYTTNKTAEMIVRTSVQHVANQARQEVWKRNSDIIKGYRITVTFDGKTSEICRNEGEKREVYQVGEGIVPPLHPFCRSGTEAVLSDKATAILDEGRKRFSRGDDGVKWVDYDQGYYEWLKTQSKEFQLSTGLGAKRVELLRNGGLTTKRFSELQLHKNFKPMTLEEMRVFEPLAFERADI